MSTNHGRQVFDKICAICKKPFSTIYQRQNICSFDCRQEAQRERSRISMRKKRHEKRKNFQPCEVCGYKIVTEPHHEVDGIHHLCPTHHALITRNYASLDEMKKDPSKW